MIYDLEVGDAISDAYKVLHDKNMRQAFVDTGRVEMWNALDLWLGDVTTGEVHKGGVVEHSLRHLRTGLTISALAMNVGVAALQPLGIIQSAVLIGKSYMADAVWTLVRPSRVKGHDPRNIVSWITEQSGFMREREFSFNKEMIEAQKNIRSGWLSRVTPGRTADHVGDIYFFFIAKAQRVTDIITWLAAKKKGLDMYGGDQEKSTLYADRMVARSQGSGNFHERTSVERGTINASVRQTEMVRIFSPFLNFFAAKLNVAYERTARTEFRNPIQAAHWAADMALLFVVEGLIARGIREGFPDEDDDETLWETAIWEGVKGFAAGVPMAREIVSRAEGFSTGGTVGSFIDKLNRTQEQVRQEEFDEALVKAANSVLGTLFKYPSSQINKTGGAIMDSLEGEDVGVQEYLMGPSFDK